jgi:hypothetical protein
LAKNKFSTGPKKIASWIALNVVRAVTLVHQTAHCLIISGLEKEKWGQSYGPERNEGEVTGYLKLDSGYKLVNMAYTLTNSELATCNLKQL